MARKIVAQCQMLDAFPHLGHKGRVGGTREIVITPFVAVYEIIQSRIYVINIWHGRQSRQ